MAGYVNPLAQQAYYRERKLAPLLSGEGIHPGVAIGPAPAEDDDGQANRDAMFQTALQNTSASASNQSNLYIQAVQKKVQQDAEARQKAYMAKQLAKIAAAKPSGKVPTVSTTLSNSNKKLVGPYKLTPAANASYNALAAAYKKAGFGNLSIISGGRTYAEQQHLYDLYLQGRGNLAAKPGTSLHESGRAVDFGGAAHSAGTAAHKWLEQNASAFGWKWTGKNFSQFEPWHFEFVG